jgi:poly-gamma-glutamate synthesis protein (capsule biosynthesis protein)
MRRIVSVILLLSMLAAALPALSEAPASAKQIVISFTGDCTLGCDPRERGQETGFETYIEKYGYEYPFAQVKELFERDDLTVVNLEGPFYNEDLSPKADTKYHFRGSTDLVNILSVSGVEACSIANNHTNDYGMAGLESTIQTLEDAGINWFGTLNDGVEGTYIFEKDGVKIGFVAVYISDWWVPGTPTKIKEQLQTLKAEGCNLLIGCMHGGVEYDTRHEMNQEKLADQLIRYGAQIVVGHHPHTIQGIREQDGVCTLWSLGNFVFGGNSSIIITRPKSPNNGKININTYIAQFTLFFDEHSVYLGHQLNIIPCYVTGTGENSTNNYQPILVSGADAEKVLKAIQDDTTPRKLRLNPYVEGVGAVQDFVPAPAQ